MGGKMVWCHAFTAAGQADAVLFINGFSLVVPRFFFVALRSNAQKLVLCCGHDGLEIYAKFV